VTHPRAHVDVVKALAGNGRNASEIAAATGISRSTVRGWLGQSRMCAPRPPWVSCPRCNEQAELDEAAYVYLLGMYLGDGTISRQRNGVIRLRIYQTARYVNLVDECRSEMQLVLPNQVSVQPKGGCVEINSYSKHWPCLFPQAGPGRKHERPIILEPWQISLVRRYPRLLLRGLIQSDGSRHLNTIVRGDKRYSYSRYEFSNASDDIRGIFTDACDLLGVHWTQMNARNISIARRGDVAFLDTFIGAKS